MKKTPSRRRFVEHQEPKATPKPQPRQEPTADYLQEVRERIDALTVALADTGRMSHAKRALQFKLELPKPLGEFHPELFGIRFNLESNHDVVRVPHGDYIAVCSRTSPRMNPQIEKDGRDES